MVCHVGDSVFAAGLPDTALRLVGFLLQSHRAIRLPNDGFIQKRDAIYCAAAGCVYTGYGVPAAGALVAKLDDAVAGWGRWQSRLVQAHLACHATWMSWSLTTRVA